MRITGGNRMTRGREAEQPTDVVCEGDRGHADHGGHERGRED
jgi:hypothetical protein